MKNKNIILIILSFFLIINSQESKGQKINKKLKGNLTVASDSTFISFDNDYKYSISINGFIIDSLQISNNYNLSSYKLIYANEYYFINTNGGEVLVLNDNKIERIDNSYTHKNQLLSSIFNFNNIIFRFGGYGFFDARNFITFFSDVSLEWEIYPTSSKIFPEGLFDNKYFLKNNEFYVLGGFNVPEYDRTTRIPNDQIWKFSFKNKKWYLIAKSKQIKGLVHSNSDFLYDGKFYYKNNNLLYSYDPSENKISKYDYLKSFDKGESPFPTLVFNNMLYSLGVSPNSKDSKHMIYKSSINDLKLLKENVLGKTYNIELIFLALTIIFTFLYTNKNARSEKEKFKIINNKVHYGPSYINLTDLEKKYLETLLEENLSENQKLISLIESNVDYSQKTRIKNSIIESLNIKISHLSREKFLICKIKSKDDRRYYSYHLKRLYK